MHPAPEENV